MNTTSNTSRRELAQRSADGIEVTLYWGPLDDSTTVEVRDLSSEDAFEIPVPRHRALEAFYHPYGYAWSSIPGFLPVRATAART